MALDAQRKTDTEQTLWSTPARRIISVFIKETFLFLYPFFIAVFCLVLFCSMLVFNCEDFERFWQRCKCSALCSMTEWGLLAETHFLSHAVCWKLLTCTTRTSMEGDFLWPVWDTTCCFIETQSGYQVTDAEIIPVNFSYGPGTIRSGVPGCDACVSATS